jgi:ABC-type uncharacterized transport system substrate-binding protein
MAGVTKKQVCVWIIFFWLFAGHVPVLADFSDKTDDGFSTSPVTNQGEKWRIGYLESGVYDNYYKSLVSTIEGLMNLEWLDRIELPQKFSPADAQGLWQWLAANARSDYLEFVPDASWCAQFNEDVRSRVRQQVWTRLNTENDIDLMLVMGTRAGLDMANDRHSTPTVIASTSDAYAAGIIKSVDDSGYDHIHAMVDEKLYELQLQIFYDIFNFQQLGVAYRHSDMGRSTAAIDSVEKMAEKLEFELVSCDLNTIISGVQEHEQKKEKIIKCHEMLASRVDAVYITRYAGGVTLDNIPALMAPLMEHHVPTFSQAGPEEVSRGVLMSMAMSRFQDIGLFYAKTIASILNGARPRDLNQRFEQPARIAINLNTAIEIGYDPSIDILAVADEIHE